MTPVHQLVRHRLLSIVTGGALTLALLSCGSDAADLADDDTAATSPATSETSSPPEPTDAETTEPAEGETIDGEGYTYAIPEGWEDISEEPEAAAADSFVRVSDASQGFGTNINVIVSPSGGATDIEAARESFKQGLETVADSPVEQVENISIDGETAIGHTATADQQGRTLVFTQYATLHEESLYIVTLTAPEDDAEDGRAALDTVLTSWAWE